MPVRKPVLHLGAAVLLAASLAALAWGLQADAALWWTTGLALALLAMAIAFATRFVPE